MHSLHSPLLPLPRYFHHRRPHQTGWTAQGACRVWSPPLWERTESLYWEVLPVRQGEGQGLSSSWVLIGPGRAKVGLWVYGCHWTGWTVRYTDRDGGVTEGKTTTTTTRTTTKKAEWRNGRANNYSTCRKQRKTDDMMKIDEMATVDRKILNRSSATFQETVIFPEVWVGSEVSGFHLLFEGKCEDEYKKILFSSWIINMLHWEHTDCTICCTEQSNPRGRARRRGGIGNPAGCWYRPTGSFLMADRCRGEFSICS